MCLPNTGRAASNADVSGDDMCRACAGRPAPGTEKPRRRTRPSSPADAAAAAAEAPTAGTC